MGLGGPKLVSSVRLQWFVAPSPRCYNRAAAPNDFGKRAGQRWPLRQRACDRHFHREASADDGLFSPSAGNRVWIAFEVKRDLLVVVPCMLSVSCVTLMR